MKHRAGKAPGIRTVTIPRELALALYEDTRALALVEGPIRDAANNRDHLPALSHADAQRAARAIRDLRGHLVTALESVDQDIRDLRALDSTQRDS